MDLHVTFFTNVSVLEIILKNVQISAINIMKGGY